MIADDQALVRAGFGMILAADGIEVVAEAANGEQALAAVRRTRPDLVLMDIRMPDMDGLEATRRILAANTPAPPRIIMLTTFDLGRYVYATLSAGASGFLLKDVTPEHLVAAVRLIRSGDAPVPHPHPRELEVLHSLAKGLNNAELATQFQLSEATVKTHVARILSKLRLRDRAQAVVVAYESGLITPGAGIPPAEDELTLRTINLNDEPQGQIQLARPARKPALHGAIRILRTVG
ncbi:two component transcriptional regulator, LuxR family [Actinobacteria bacterium OK074]|nr:two component transcriptional regulator, LuxR family [Actinobacteria bacterium OK074]